MKKAFAKLLVLVTALAAVAASAETKIMDGVQWTFWCTFYTANPERDYITIGSADFSSTAVPVTTSGAIAIPATFDDVNVNVGHDVPVTSIAGSAFSGCSKLTSVTIPRSVKNIGPSAFSGCSNLKSILFAGNAPAGSVASSSFSGTASDCVIKVRSDSTGWGVSIPGTWCGRRIEYMSSIESSSLFVKWTINSDRVLTGVSLKGVATVAIPDGITGIGTAAFRDCSSLVSVTIPKSVTSIGSSAFYGCSSLSVITMDGNAPSIGSSCFSGVASGCVVKVNRGSTGWGVAIPGTWKGMRIEYFCKHDGTTSIVDDREATCAEAGYTGDRVCDICGEVQVYGTTIPSLGHNMGAGVVTKVPTVSEAGVMSYYCTRCGILMKTESISTLDISQVLCDCLGGLLYGSVTLGSDEVQWSRDSETTHNGSGSLRLMGNGDDSESSIRFAVRGAGQLSYWWKISSEYDAEDNSVYDYAYLTVDGEDQGGLTDDYELFGHAIGGNTDWTNVEININGAGSHTVVWTYKKDEVDEIAGFEDCVWLENVMWRPMVSASFALGGGIGTVPASMGGLSGTPVTLPSGESFSRDGYVFDGWSDGMTKYAAGVAYTLPERNVTLTAQWIRKSILTFDLNGGQGAAPTAISNVPGTTVSLPSANGISKAKHTFAGWSDGNVTYAAGASYTMPDCDVAFSAVWKAKTITTPTISSPQVSNGGVVTDTGSVTLLLSAGSGARIYYTLDGSVPTSASLLYEEPLTFTDYAVTIKAIALRDDYFDSDVAEFSFTRKPYTLAECLGLDNMDGVAVSASGDGEAWHRVGNGESHDGVAGLRSGAITHSQTNWVEVTTTGEGVLSFWWKASSESIRGKPRDGAMFYVDGVQIGDMLGGTTGDWEQRFYTAVGEGPHVFRWAYGKSATDAADVGEDCAWLDEVVWRSVVEPIEYENLRGASNTNPSTYYEGSRVAFADPGAVVGYSFAGWVPSEITPDMTGPQTIRANWTANRYSIAYDANGGSGEMSATEAEYDAGSTISQPTFSRPGYMATGWATNATGRVVYEAGQVVTNLTAQQGGVIRLYAVWVKNLAPEISVGGASAAMRCAAMPLGLRIALWNRFEQTTAAEPIPSVAVDAAPEVVTNAIEAAGFADAAAIKAAIGGEGAATKYAAFREWAGSVKGALGSAGAASAAGEAAVVANTNAAAAWLLGAERLFDKQPTIGLEEVSVGRSIEDNDQGGSLGTGQPTMTVSVVVRDGEEAVQCAAEKVRAMFEATSDLGDWDGTAKLAPAVTVEGNDGATMRFKVTPGDGASDRAFLRVKVK